MQRLPILLVLVTLPACDAYTGSTPGESGRINFYEPNTYPDDETFSSQGFELSIANGARVDVWMTSPGITSITGAEIDRPEVLSIESDFYPIVLRTRSEGTARLRVTQNDGVSDTIPLTVVAADDARVWIPTEDRLFGASDSFFGDGYALRPGATIRIAGQPLANGRPLLGFDVLEWSIDETLFAHDADSSVVNMRRLEALGASGVTTISTQFGGDVEVATLSDTDVPVLRLHTIGEDLSYTEASALTARDTALFALTGNDAEGRFVLPGRQDNRDFSATITEGTITLLEASLSDRHVSLRVCPGTGTIQLSYLGAELSVPIEATPEVADEDCP